MAGIRDDGPQRYFLKYFQNVLTMAALRIAMQLQAIVSQAHAMTVEYFSHTFHGLVRLEPAEN
jgi:TATA-box binding protein (TBP) (component of TFIID and TFIIIB)